MTKAHILVHTLDFPDDGYSILGVFTTIEKLRDYVQKYHPEYEMDLGSYAKHNPPGEDQISVYEYLTPIEVELDPSQRQERK